MALLIVPHKLVSWGFVMNTDTGSPLHCHLQTGFGPIQSLFRRALWTLLLHEAEHLPESSAEIQSRNSKDSSVWHMTPCTVQPEYYDAWIYKHFYSSSQSPILSAEISLNIHMCSYPIPPLHIETEHWHTAAIIWK
jgi:hypothetical protein